jgi:hypothetical protein
MNVRHFIDDKAEEASDSEESEDDSEREILDKDKKN